MTCTDTFCPYCTPLKVATNSVGQMSAFKRPELLRGGGDHPQASHFLCANPCNLEGIASAPFLIIIVWSLGVKRLPSGCLLTCVLLSLQEIDGKALMLLRSDVIMKYMGLKLGPALKLCHHIEKLKQTKQ